jgi:hypothetical protein
MKRNVVLAWPILFGFVLILVGTSIYLGSVIPLMNAQTLRTEILHDIEDFKWKITDESLSPQNEALYRSIIDSQRKMLFGMRSTIPNLTLVNRIGMVTLLIGAIVSITAALTTRANSEEK